MNCAQRRIGLQEIRWLTEDVAQKILRNGNLQDLSSYDKMELKAAEVLARHEGLLILSSLTWLDGEIDDEVALALARHKGGLILRGLSWLGDSPGNVALAKTLANNEGVLDLSNLRDVGDLAARALATHKGGIILSGMNSLNDSPGHVALAGALANNDGILDLGGLQDLSDAAAAALANHKGGILLKSLKCLNDSPGHIALAGVLSDIKGILDLDGLNRLGCEVARELSRHQQGVKIGGLRTLGDSPEHLALARSLANFHGMLYLTNVQDLGDSVAAALSKHKGGIILSGMNSLNDSPGHVALAGALANNDGILDLGGLQDLSDAAAAALANHKGGILLKRLKCLNDSPGHVALARTLGDNEGIIDLSSLRHLSDAAARELAKHNSNICCNELNSFTHLSADVARVLAKCQGVLKIRITSNLSDESATALAQHKGGLIIDGLTILSDSPGHVALAETLSKNEGPLDLGLLISLSDAAACALAKHNGDLIIHRLSCLTNEGAKKLAKCRGQIFLRCLTCLSTSQGHIALAKKLAKTNGMLYLVCLNYIGEKAAQALARHKGGIALTGLVNLSDSVAKALSRYKGGLVAKCSRILFESVARVLGKREDPLYLDGVKFMSDAAAYSLAQYNGFISLSGLVCLCDSPGHLALARSLTRKGGDIFLDGLTSLSSSVASLLSKNHCSIYLRGLTNISDAAAKELAASKGEIHLDGLTNLSDVAAGYLAACQGDLYLKGLIRLSDVAAELFAKRKGGLHLGGVIDLSDVAVETLAAKKGYVFRAIS